MKAIVNPKTKQALVLGIDPVVKALFAIMYDTSLKLIDVHGTSMSSLINTVGVRLNAISVEDKISGECYHLFNAEQEKIDSFLAQNFKIGNVVTYHLASTPMVIIDIADTITTNLGQYTPEDLRHSDLKCFTITWRNDDTKEYIFGTSISDAFRRAGYGSGALSALDSYENGYHV